MTELKSQDCGVFMPDGKRGYIENCRIVQFLNLFSNMLISLIQQFILLFRILLLFQHFISFCIKFSSLTLSMVRVNISNVIQVPPPSWSLWVRKMKRDFFAAQSPTKKLPELEKKHDFSWRNIVVPTKRNIDFEQIKQNILALASCSEEDFLVRWIVLDTQESKELFVKRLKRDS